MWVCAFTTDQVPCNGLHNRCSDLCHYCHPDCHRCPTQTKENEE